MICYLFVPSTSIASRYGHLVLINQLGTAKQHDIMPSLFCTTANLVQTTHWSYYAFSIVAFWKLTTPPLKFSPSMVEGLIIEFVMIKSSYPSCGWNVPFWSFSIELYNCNKFVGFRYNDDMFYSIIKNREWICCGRKHNRLRKLFWEDGVPWEDLEGQECPAEADR